MAARRKVGVREAELGFDALSIEGALLSPAWLGKVAQVQAEHQTEGDYCIPKGLNLRDEIGRYWRIAQAHWAEFVSGRAANGDAKTIAERFVLALLRDSFGFSSLTKAEPVDIGDRRFPIGFSALAGTVPVVIAPAGLGLEVATLEFGDDHRKRTAFGLAQELLNARDEALWGIATDGLRLRILRDNGSLTRPAWIEADLERIFTEQRYADFNALWLLVHESRFGREGQSPSSCALEAWRSAGHEEGTRARDKLRRGVEEALLALGQGFLAHPANESLRTDLRSGALTQDAYFNELLRLVYRLIFLLTVEERRLLHPEDTPEAVAKLYAEGYSLRRLRERAVRRSAHDRFHDLWDGTRVVFRGLAHGEARLGLPALAGLFDARQTPHLDASRLENRALLTAVFKLAWIRVDHSLSRVNWRDMGPEELGSVYESLLELVPLPNAEARTFTFAGTEESKGNARKTSGSYYTPDSLVQVLLDSALEPVVAETLARNPGKEVESLLGLSIVDPACGSGHFLLSAARRLAAHIARFEAKGTPTANEYRSALRRVVGHCIYGVDLNPLAVELCKVALWMEAMEPSKALTFLDSHIQVGNALLGTTPELMRGGIPDAAWTPIEGDDKKTASALKKRNKKNATQESFAFLTGVGTEQNVIDSQVQNLEAERDDTADAVHVKEKHWSEIQESREWRHQKLVADAWCAAFVWPKQEKFALAAPTNEVWRALRDNAQVPLLTSETAKDIAKQFRFFHWHLQFPHVFKRGGFDVVLGNPPWERVKLQEQEFFASRDEKIATAANAAARKKLIAELPESNPQLCDEWTAASRRAEGESQLIRQSGRYPLCGKGDVNTYAVFAEHNRSALGPIGRAGFIVPTGIATDDTTKEYFGTLVGKQELARFYSFENEEFVFPGVHHAFRFALLTVAKGGGAPLADLVFFARSVPALSGSERHFSLSPADFEALNPNTRTCPTFRSKRDAELNLKLYRRAGVLWREADEENGNPWGLRFMAMLHMANDSGSFRTRAELESAGWKLDGNIFVNGKLRALPLVEAKMVHYFDHRYGTYEAQSEAQRNQGKLPEFDDAAHADSQKLTLPDYWVAESEVSERLEGRWDRGWLLGWRDICRSTDQRTLIASLIPRVAVGHTSPLMMPAVEPRLIAALYANLCSFVLDYATRQKVGGTHLTYGYLKQLPVLAPQTYEDETPWHRGILLRDWLLPRVLELTYTARDLQPFARDVGYDGTPFQWDADRRFQLRCELDAAFFHLYGLSRDDADYVMETFPIVRKNDEKAHGEYRTKLAILAEFDAMAEAERSGKAYVSRLDQQSGMPASRSNVVQLRLVPRALPAADLGALASGAWKRPHVHGEVQVAILAVLKANVAPMEQKKARLAALLCLEPHLLTPQLDKAEQMNWKRVIGDDAKKSQDASVDATTQEWGTAVTGLRGRGRIVEDDERDTWALGAGTDAIPTSGWPEGRAAFVVSVLRRLHKAAMVEDLVSRLPAVVQKAVKDRVTA